MNENITPPKKFIAFWKRQSVFKKIIFIVLAYFVIGVPISLIIRVIKPTGSSSIAPTITQTEKKWYDAPNFACGTPDDWKKASDEERISTIGYYIFYLTKTLPNDSMKPWALRTLRTLKELTKQNPIYWEQGGNDLPNTLYINIAAASNSNAQYKELKAPDMPCGPKYNPEWYEVPPITDGTITDWKNASDEVKAATSYIYLHSKHIKISLSDTGFEDCTSFSGFTDKQVKSGIFEDNAPLKDIQDSAFVQYKEIFN